MNLKRIHLLQLIRHRILVMDIETLESVVAFMEEEE